MSEFFVNRSEHKLEPTIVRMGGVKEGAELYRSQRLDNIIDLPIVRMEGIKETAELFGLPKNLIRTLALEGKVKAVRIGNGKNAKILINIQSLNEYFNSSVIGTQEQADTSGGIQPIPVEI